MGPEPRYSVTEEDAYSGLGGRGLTSKVVANEVPPLCHINETGGYPTNNFTKGQFKNVDKISGETQAELEEKRGGNPTHGCHRGCVIKCSGIFVDKEGNYVSKQPEYETVWAHCANCGIDDLDVIARLDRMDDDFGLDTIEMGAAIAVAMEAGQLDPLNYFQKLLDTIFSSFSSVPVEIINNAEKQKLPTKTAISLGLIINELATNVIKYGFSGRH